MNLRIFEDPESGKPWDKSVADVGLEILCVSQVCLATNIHIHTHIRSLC